MILTPELIEARAKARKAYPDATWLPGDAPPIGQTATRDGFLCTVLGPSDHPEMPYWWLVRFHDHPKDVAYEWPPALRPSAQ